MSEAYLESTGTEGVQIRTPILDIQHARHLGAVPDLRQDIYEDTIAIPDPANITKGPSDNPLPEGNLPELKIDDLGPPPQDSARYPMYFRVNRRAMVAEGVISVSEETRFTACVRALAKQATEYAGVRTSTSTADAQKLRTYLNAESTVGDSSVRRGTIMPFAVAIASLVGELGARNDPLWQLMHQVQRDFPEIADKDMKQLQQTMLVAYQSKRLREMYANKITALTKNS